MLDGKEFGGVMDSAVAVVVVANGAIKHMIGQNPVESLTLRFGRTDGVRSHVHVGLDPNRAGSDQLAVAFNHTSIAGLNRAELRMVAHLRDLDAGSVEQLQQWLARNRFQEFSIKLELNRQALASILGWARTGQSNVGAWIHACG